jgi:glycosyltransferase involved in cell wall biosynthesis
VFVMPCVVAADGDRDSMPVVVKEAMAMEIPVIVTDEVGLPELVTPACARVVEPGDAEALAVALREMLALPRDERVAMGVAARARVLEVADVRAETARLSGLVMGIS